MTQSRSNVLAGALAGASVVVILMIAATFLLATGSLWQYAFNISIPIIRDTAGAAVLQDASRIPGFLWGWRWIILGMTAGGAGLALLDRFVQRYPPIWRSGLVSTIVFVLVGAVVTAVVLMSAEQVLVSGADQSASLATLNERRYAIWGQLLIAAALSLALAGTIWLAWSWWYSHWRRWLRLDRAPVEVNPEDTTADQLFAQRAARSRARRTVLLGLAGSIVLLIIAVFGYDQVRASVQSGELWVKPDEPSSGVQLQFTRSTRQIFVENTFGKGSVIMSLLSIGASQPVAPPVAITFRDERVSYEHSALDVATLSDGSYLLHAQLQSGEGGRVGFALIQSGGASTLIMAIVVGLCLGLLLALIVLLFSMRSQAET